jgi:hypothetical protein
VNSSASVLRAKIEAVLEKRIPAALTPRAAFEPELLPFGIPEFDGRRLGIPRGCVTEICGAASSGRTTLLLAALREITQRGECGALVDTSNAFDPYSAASNGVNLKNLLVVRCASPHAKLSSLDKALKAVSLIVHDGGFGLVVLDLGDIGVELAQRIPLSHWFSYRRAVESTNSCLVLIEQHPFAKSCAAQVITLRGGDAHWTATRNQRDAPKLLTGVRYIAEVTRTRATFTQRKPPGFAGIPFHVATAWAG